jgi:peptidoglycan-associated lipoprotein
MRKNFSGALLILSFGLLLTSGCAKDQVKPDEGIAGTKAAPAAQETQAASQQKAAAADQQAAAERAAAEKAAAERAAAEKAAAERAAAERAAAERAAAEKAAAQQQLEDAARNLKTIHFDFDQYVLRQQDRDILYNNAEFLLKKYKGKVKLEGHCDERGSDEYNLALGENRAKAAVNYLLTLGVPAEQLSIISYGKERPVDPGHTEEAWAKNRRVDFVIIK